MTTFKSLTPQQVLQSMDEKWKYIAKDKDGAEYAFSEEPEAEESKWKREIGEFIKRLDGFNIEWQSNDWTQCCVSREEVAETGNDGWIDWSGKRNQPDGIDGKNVFVTDDEGQVHCGDADGYNWNYIKAYQIIPTPEPYQPPKPDYSKWVGCLCKFWDEDEENACFGSFDGLNSGVFHFQVRNGKPYIHCRPARQDEIKFVKD